MSRTVVRSAFAAAALYALYAAGAAFADDMAPAKTAETSKGAALVDAKGMTLYTFAKDAGGKSACNGGCAANWPPLMAAAGSKASGDWTIVARDDGSSQWAYRGMPLYAFRNDKKAGDATGDGMFGGAWKVAKP